MNINFLPPVIAHRGASFHAPENTMCAFIKAAQLGVQWLEMDVMQTADQQLIVFHDELLDRTTNATGPLILKTFTQLRSLDAGAWFDPRYASERIPALSEVMQWLMVSKLSVNLEIKVLPGQEENLVKHLLAELKQYPPQIQILFSSFSLEFLYCLRQACKDCSIALLMDEWRGDWQKICEELQCVSVHVNQALLTEERIKQVKNQGKKLLCYTVNDPQTALKLYSLGVDAVFSDVPGQILSAFGAGV